MMREIPYTFLLVIWMFAM